MFEVLEPSPEGVVRVTARDRLSHEDYTQLVARLEQFIAKHGSDRCWIELAGFDGVEPGALVDETRFAVCRCREIRRCAIVGDWAWSVCMTRFAKAVFPEAEVRYFEHCDVEEAQDWFHPRLAAASLVAV
ncbi:MAG: STAS/SEC14 domain-containing protein [Pirellulales bacterium]|nr:STAS/SEC14 domain-containing protein [Pirellulales bacterium]